MQGRLFNIQRFSVHDGPGIRTTMFFKGCNLRCSWCHNPESYRMEQEMQYFRERCTDCKACVEACGHGLLVEEGKRRVPKDCVHCRRCEEACLNSALKYAGQEYTVRELTELALRDKAYYESSGGGVTASGGEPLLQDVFLEQLFAQLKEKQIATALDTAGHVEFSRFERVLPYTDLVLLDLKIMDEKKHREYTGVSNRRILQNARRLMEMGQRIHIRVPIIAGINDTMENARALKEFIGESGSVEQVRFLPYHNMGLTKGSSVGVEMEAFSPPSKERLEEIRSLFGEIAR